MVTPGLSSGAFFQLQRSTLAPLRVETSLRAADAFADAGLNPAPALDNALDIASRGPSIDLQLDPTQRLNALEQSDELRSRRQQDLGDVPATTQTAIQTYDLNETQPQFERTRTEIAGVDVFA